MIGVVVGAGCGSINLRVLLAKIVLPAVLAPIVVGLDSLVATRSAYATTKKRQRDGLRIAHANPAHFVHPKPRGKKASLAAAAATLHGVER